MVDTMRCLLVTKRDDGKVERAITTRPTSDLPAGDVVVRVRYSSLNYKDALGCTGHPGVVNKFPHVPGIDAAGVVEESTSPKFTPGAEVLVTGFELGARRWGGYAEFIRVPADWVVPLPTGLSLRESMAIGTAGFTAALCVQAIELQGIGPKAGDVVVTGASGGVGTLAVSILAQTGYRVTAVSGKPEQADLLRKLGAAEVVRARCGRRQIRSADAESALGGGGRYRRRRHALDAVAIDAPGGCVAACGLGRRRGFAGHGLSVHLARRGAGGRKFVVVSSSAPTGPVGEIGRRRGSRECSNELVTEVRLEDLEPKIQEILAGKIVGRVVVKD